MIVSIYEVGRESGLPVFTFRNCDWLSPFEHKVLVPDGSEIQDKDFRLGLLVFPSGLSKTALSCITEARSESPSPYAVRRVRFC